MKKEKVYIVRYIENIDHSPLIKQSINYDFLRFYFDMIGISYKKIPLSHVSKFYLNKVILYEISGFGDIRLFHNEVFKYIPDLVIEQLRNNKNFYLLLGAAQEGFNTDITLIQQWCKSNSVPKNKLIFLTGNYKHKEYYAEWSKKYATINVNMFYIPYFERESRGYIGDADYPTVDTVQRKYIWLSLNRVPREHRILHIASIHKEKIQDKILWSIGDHEHDGIEQSLISVVDKATNISFGDLREYMKTDFITEVEYPKVLDLPTFDNCKATKPLASDLFSKSYFSIVTETLYTSDIIFLSEKIWKPILNLHPFVVFGNRHTLKTLKKQGYKTFSKIFDESYDDIENTSDRFAALNAEITRISKMSMAEIHDMYSSVHDILLYNQTVFMEKRSIQKEENQFLKFLKRSRS